MLILNHFCKNTYSSQFDSLHAVQSLLCNTSYSSNAHIKWEYKHKGRLDAQLISRVRCFAFNLSFLVYCDMASILFYLNKSQHTCFFLKIKFSPKVILGMEPLQEEKISYSKDQGLKICAHVQIMCSEKYVHCKFVFHGFLAEENSNIT